MFCSKILTRRICSMVMVWLDWVLLGVCGCGCAWGGERYGMAGSPLDTGRHGGTEEAGNKSLIHCPLFTPPT